MIFLSGYKLTQAFGLRPDYYGQWGFAGHEGIDLIPKDLNTSWDIYPPETVTIVRDVDVPRDNYGIYAVGLNQEHHRAWWFCHLQTNYVKVGQVLSPNEAVGRMGSTGKVTGAHLHLGLRQADSSGNAINLENGYKGFINPLPLIEQLGGLMSQTMTVDIPTWERIRSNSEKGDYLCSLLGLEADISQYDKTSFLQVVKPLVEAVDRAKVAEAKISELDKTVLDLQGKIGQAPPVLLQKKTLLQLLDSIEVEVK